ncbi:hypothetical protein P9B03_03930 [Metasolibacillus meyeri]|uniref:Uncharacterized protein n=1 Tax=Metasolibacillus meyeri TaxID=1071052 RepID=A0AAW9NTU7_9BACL|nr:hypothetical protein [Metasolibacillus meyeri]MEC1177623.1 hypothetical protein [Metasolibacillus meyeri]
MSTGFERRVSKLRNKVLGGNTELQKLRERGRELDIPRATQMGEEKLRATIAEKEKQLAEQEE